jgi:hypothetical protein
MFTISYPYGSRIKNSSAPLGAVGHWLKSRLAARKRQLGRRLMIARLQQLRNRDPSFFTDLRLAAHVSPPPTLGSGSLLPHVVISGYLFGDL